MHLPKLTITLPLAVVCLTLSLMSSCTSITNKPIEEIRLLFPDQDQDALIPENTYPVRWRCLCRIPVGS